MIKRYELKHIPQLQVYDVSDGSKKHSQYVILTRDLNKHILMFEQEFLKHFKHLKNKSTILQIFNKVFSDWKTQKISDFIGECYIDKNSIRCPRCIKVMKELPGKIDFYCKTCQIYWKITYDTKIAQDNWEKFTRLGKRLDELDENEKKEYWNAFNKWHYESINKRGKHTQDCPVCHSKDSMSFLKPSECDGEFIKLFCSNCNFKADLSEIYDIEHNINRKTL